jgi:ferredoxin
MKVRINSQCMGDRNCNKLCPEVFEYDEDQLLSIVKFDEIPEKYHDLVRQAAAECVPVAIEIEEEVLRGKIQREPNGQKPAHLVCR